MQSQLIRTLVPFSHYIHLLIRHLTNQDISLCPMSVSISQVSLYVCTECMLFCQHLYMCSQATYVRQCREAKLSLIPAETFKHLLAALCGLMYNLYA